jgi:hypothetical protein
MQGLHEDVLGEPGGPLFRLRLSDEKFREVLTSLGRCGASFENPTKAGIVAAVEECKRNA